MKHNAILNCICTFAIFICIASEQVLETEQQDEMQVSTSSRKAVAYATPRDMRSRRRNLGSNDNLKALALQPCIDECDSLGFCCGNRINGEAGEYCLYSSSAKSDDFFHHRLHVHVLTTQMHFFCSYNRRKFK